MRGIVFVGVPLSEDIKLSEKDGYVKAMARAMNCTDSDCHSDNYNSLMAKYLEHPAKCNYQLRDKCTPCKAIENMLFRHHARHCPKRDCDMPKCKEYKVKFAFHKRQKGRTSRGAPATNYETFGEVPAVTLNVTHEETVVDRGSQSSWAKLSLRALGATCVTIGMIGAFSRKPWPAVFGTVVFCGGLLCIGYTTRSEKKTVTNVPAQM